jgi:hypothetical protein
MTSTKLGAYLQDIPVLQQLGLERLLMLQRCYAETVPLELAEASRVGALEGNALIIMALNGPVAAKIKQQIPSVLEKIQQNYQQVTTIKVIVQANMSHIREHPAKRISVSSSALDGLETLEQGLADTSPLKRALQKLLAHQGR